MLSDFVVLEAEEDSVRRLRDEVQRHQRTLEQLREEKDAAARREASLTSRVNEAERDISHLRREKVSLTDELERARTARKGLEERLEQEQARSLASLQQSSRSLSSSGRQRLAGSPTRPT